MHLLSSSSPLAIFTTLLVSQPFACLISFIMTIYPIIGTFNFKDGEQWTATIMIFDMVLLVIRTFYSLYSTGMLGTAFPLMASIMCGFSLLSSCKCYLERFVGLDKI